LGFLLSGNLGLQNFFVNNWTRTVSKPGSGAPLNKLGLAFSIDVNVYDNEAVASIGSGALINQDLAYQKPKQSVTVAAETYVDEINVTGMFDANVYPDSYAKLNRKRTILDAKTGKSTYPWEQLFSVFGNRSGGVGIGVSVPVTVVNNTATAEIDGG